MATQNYSYSANFQGGAGKIGVLNGFARGNLLALPDFDFTFSPGEQVSFRSGPTATGRPGRRRKVRGLPEPILSLEVPEGLSRLEVLQWIAGRQFVTGTNSTDMYRDFVLGNPGTSLEEDMSAAEFWEIAAVTGEDDLGFSITEDDANVRVTYLDPTTGFTVALVREAFNANAPTLATNFQVGASGLIKLSDDIPAGTVITIAFRATGSFPRLGDAAIGEYWFLGQIVDEDTGEIFTLEIPRLSFNEDTELPSRVDEGTNLVVNATALTLPGACTSWTMTKTPFTLPC